MARGTFVTDWRGLGKWTPHHKRRRCDAGSFSSYLTAAPIPADVCPVPMTTLAWPWLARSGGVWLRDPATWAGYVWSTVEANGWHLFDGEGPIMIWTDGTNETYAIDLRQTGCAEFIADAFLGWPGYQWVKGVHFDYYVNPVSLGAAGFELYHNDAQFMLDFDLGIARMVQRIRDQRPDWVLVGQVDNPLGHTGVRDAMKSPLNGYFLERYIGRFNPQTSFATVRQWMLDHQTYLATNAPGRPWHWVMEYWDPVTTATPPFGYSSWDAYLVDFLALADEVGAWVSRGRDVSAIGSGYAEQTGRYRRTVRLRPRAVGSAATMSLVNATDAVAAVTDGDDSTGLAGQSYQTHRFLFDALPADAADVLNVRPVARAKADTGLSTDLRFYLSQPGAYFNNDTSMAANTMHYRRLSTSLGEKAQDVPRGSTGTPSTPSDWTVAEVNSLEVGVVADLTPLTVTDLALDVDIEVSMPAQKAELVLEEGIDPTTLYLVDVDSPLVLAEQDDTTLTLEE